MSMNMNVNNMNSKTALYITVACIFINGLFFQTRIFSMNNENTKRRVTVYSHGFGEYGSSIGPTYPDAPGVISKAVFYTKPAVHTLANYLKKKIDEGYLAIHLEARSCGAGTAINCLAKLAHYNQDPRYFDGTAIKSKADADAIVNAINNGSLHLTVPFLGVKKAIAIAIPSACLGYTSILAAGGAAYHWGVFDRALTAMGVTSTPARALTAIATSIAASYALSSGAKNFWAALIDTTVLPCITRFHYNPFHIKPLKAAQKLKGHIKCPTLIHCCKQDGVLESPDEDTVQFYAALRTSNKERTHIYLSEPGDGWHNAPSAGHRKVEEAFKAKYNIESSKKLSSPSPPFASTQPTPEQLRRSIIR